MKIQKCHTCGKLGVGPHLVKLFEFEGRLYCERGTPDQPGCYRSALNWHGNRSSVVTGIAHLGGYQKEAAKIYNKHDYLQWPKRRPKVEWRGYIEEYAGISALAMMHGDKRTFVYCFSRAMYAWTLKELT